MTRKQVMTAIIYDRRGRVLSIGKNSYEKTHPMMAFHATLVNEPYKVFMHAEISAIVRCHDLEKAHTISVFRYDALGRPALAKPCSICQSAIRAANIPYIEHT